MYVIFDENPKMYLIRARYIRKSGIELFVSRGRSSIIGSCSLATVREMMRNKVRRRSGSG